jgi:branched-chain amino acid transport system ATP-binding protein
MTGGAPAGLACQDLVIGRAGTTVIRGVSIEARPGQVTVILGANGAGKTTLLEGLSGLIPARSGTVRLSGEDVTRLSAARRARAGLCHIEQGRPVFADLTVEENLLVTAPRSRTDPAYAMFPELERLRGRRAGLLSGGEQQMLVIARAILLQPRVLLLDEISLGLAPAIVARLLPAVKTLAGEGLTVVLVEQFAQLALPLGHQAYVLAKGLVVYDGPCRALLNDAGLLHSAYLTAEEGPRPE